MALMSVMFAYRGASNASLARLPWLLLLLALWPHALGAQPLATNNPPSSNLSTNSLSTNSLSTNSLSTNSLSTNSLSTNTPPTSNPSSNNLSSNNLSTVQPIQVNAQAQFDAGEFDAAIKAARTSIDTIESRGRPFDPVVVNQYRILGDAHFALGDTEEALRAFSLARQELRMLGGLHDPAQLALLYREADVHSSLNDIKSANDRHEYAFELQRNDPLADQIEATKRLARWYEDNGHDAAARDLYRNALELSENQANPNTVQRARLYRAIAWTYRSQYFPDAKASQPKAPYRILTPKPYGIVWRDIEHLTIDQSIEELLFRARRSLRQSRDLLALSEDSPIEEVAETLLHLGDWHLLTRKYGRAFDTYGDLYELLETHRPALLETMLGKAELLHMKDLGNPTAKRGYANPDYGFIELEVAVDRMGVARKLRTVHMDPAYLSDEHFRATLRRARFRPAIIDGVPTYTDNVRVSYTFD